MLNFLVKKNLLRLKPVKILVFSGFFLLACFVIVDILINIKVDKVNAQNSPDAIAIRVLPNPSHYSALRWYTEKGFEGSPQSLVVDGYDAVRDGRTVYVNAVNVAASNLFTNIYLISYNHEAERMTVDIFGRILTHWKFNSNIDTIGTCKDDSTIFCTLDDDCPMGDMCMSIKSRIIRDVRRLADLAEITILLDVFNDKNGNYPLLGAGTYLPNRVLSVWPSWQETFSNDIGSSLPVDPINVIGDCVGYNPVTCWNEANKTFVYTLPNIPANSLIYEYITDENGNNYDLCAIFESGLVMTGATYANPAFCPDICLDNDNDGYGFPGSVLCSAGSPLSDCDDNNSAITIFGTPEVCTGGFDEDCDGLTDCTDSDCASLPICALTGFCNNNGTCEPGLGETCSSCPADFCCVPPPCGDGFCNLPGECATCYGPGLDCRCGNWNIECSETCDDGNIISGDGCSDMCMTEAGACTDVDGDLFILESTAIGICGNVCGPANNQICVGNNDCDDTLATGFSIHPGATDICNGIDDDCNVFTPDGFGEVAPFNSSQFGVCAGSFQSCAGAVGWIDDYTGVVGYVMPEAPCDGVDDNDCDGIPDATDPDCTGICNDTDETDHIGASAGCYQCNNTTDDDGNQIFPLFPTTEADWIAAGFGNMIDPCDPACGPGLSVIDLDSYENGNEISCDGLDNNCNGIMDDATAPPCPLQAGVCAGATQTCGGVAGWQPCTAVEYGPFYEATETLCDGLDNDCDGSVDEGCICIDGSSQSCGSNVGACTMGIEICSGGAWGACVGGILPVPEVCNGLDDDCNGANDDGLVAPLNDNQNGVCAGSFKICNGAAGWINDYSAVPNNEWPLELSCDNLDNNCDNSIDEGVTQQCGATGVGECQYGVETCSAGSWGACTGEIGPVAEICDGLDNDCSGIVDDGLTAPLNTLQAGVCLGSFQTCSGFPGWLDDYSGVVNYEVVETLCDTLDNDCDGSVDESCSAGSCILTFTLPCNFP